MKLRSTHKTSVPREQRDAMIAEAAYYLALHRGFAPGCEVDDWLQAESQITRQLGETEAADSMHS